MKYFPSIPTITKNADTGNYPRKNYDDMIHQFHRTAQKAENTLEYSLFLPEITPLSSNIPEDSWVERAAFECYKNCHCKLFQTTQYLFFGNCFIENKDSILSYIPKHFFISEDLTPDKFTNSDILQNDFFASTILFQSIMAAYDTTMLLLPFKKITAYAMDKYNDWGFQNLANNDKIITSGFPFYRKSSESLSDNPSAKLTTQKSASRHSIFSSDLLKNVFHLNEGNYKDLDFYFADIYLRLFKMNAKSLGTFLEMYESYPTKNKSDRKNWNIFCKTYELLNYTLQITEKGSSPSDRVDALYHYYKLENIFGLDLSTHMYRAFSHSKDTYEIYPDGINSFKLLAELSCFPNVFSRSLYLDYILEIIRFQLPIHDSFLINPPPAEAMIIKSPPKKFDYGEWEITVKKFCILFNQLIFPSEEWYFFLILKKTLDARYPKELPETRYLRLQKLLASYIDKNHQLLINPRNSQKANKSAPQAYEFDSRNPDIALLLSLFRTANEHTKLPLPPLDKDKVLPTKDDLYFKKLMQYYISVIEDI